MRDECLNILIVDDQQEEVLDIYEDVIQRLGHRVECFSVASEAMRHIKDTLFDVALVDAKLPYKTAYLGGLLLADDIGKILGTRSVLIMSQFDVGEEVLVRDPPYPFVKKPKSGFGLLDWVRNELMKKVGRLVDKQIAFVAMPFGDSEFDEWYFDRIRPWMGALGYKVRRMDEIATTRFVSQEALERIRQAHFVVFFADKQNPNAYFEAGYALALDKFVIVLSKDRERVPFDIRSNYVLPLDILDPNNTKIELEHLISGLRNTR